MSHRKTLKSMSPACLAMGIAIALLATYLATARAATTTAFETGPTPNAQLTPDEVVRIQLEALRANDLADHGIEICFRFASPQNQANTGPVSRFGAMIKQGVYALMLDYEDASYGDVEVVAGHARQRVTLVGTNKIVT